MFELRSILSRCCLAALTSTLLVMPGYAQADQADQTAEQEQKEPATQSKEVIVTATRIDTPLSQVGSSVTVVTSEQMQLRQDQDIADALQHVPGVHVRRTGGIGSQATVFIRGAESDQTLMLLDGIKIHDVASPGGTATLDNLMTTGLGRIEVLKGPQSTLYGTEAIGGVINATTKRGKGPVNGFYSIETGSYKTTTQKLYVNGGDDNFNYSVSATRIDADVFSSAADNSESDPYRNTSFSSLFGFTPFDAFNVDVAFHYINANIEFDNNGVDDGTAQTDYEQYAAKVEPTFYLLDGLWQTKLILTLNKTKRLTDGTNFTVANSGFNYTFLPNGFGGQTLEADWQNTLFLSDSQTVVFGVDYTDERGTFSDPGVTDQTYSTNSYSIYLQDQWKITDDLTVNAGLRYINHNQFGGQTTYQLSSAYHFTPTDTILRASVGTGFKAPSIADLFDNGNPNLNPEKSLGWDVGIEQPLLNDKLTVGTTFFQNTIDDMIFTVETVPFTYQLINIGKARTQGVETFIQYKPTEDLIATFNYTYTDSEVLDPQGKFGPQKGARLWRRPLHSYGFDLTKQFLDNRANITFSVLGASARDDNGGKADGYVICNIAGSCKITKNISVFARVVNIFNEQYQDLRGFNTADASGYAGVKISF